MRAVLYASAERGLSCDHIAVCDSLLQVLVNGHDWPPTVAPAAPAQPAVVAVAVLASLGTLKHSTSQTRRSRRYFPAGVIGLASTIVLGSGVAAR
jgi:hypothetical protein